MAVTGKCISCGGIDDLIDQDAYCGPCWFEAVHRDYDRERRRTDIMLAITCGVMVLAAVVAWIGERQ